MMSMEYEQVRNSIIIFCIFDRDGIVDDYVLHLANCLRPYAGNFILVVKGDVQADQSSGLEELADSVIQLDNKGYDFGAYKQVILEYIGWDCLEQYDELLLVNDSCYGPLFPFSELFEEMDARKNDFWGITLQPPIYNGYYSKKILPTHIQSYFLAIEERMLHSEAFRTFWETAEPSDDYMQTVWNFELRFTEYFSKHGFTYSSYVDASDFADGLEETQVYIFFDTYRLISEARCPLLKRKAFTTPHEVVLTSNQGENAGKTLKYIQESTSYDEGYIIENLIRILNPYDLYTSLHLDYVISAYKYKKMSKSIIIWMGSGTNKFLAGHSNVIVCRTCEDLIRKKNEILDYDIICLVDSGCSEDELLNCIGDGENYVLSVADIFEQNRYLGMLFAGLSIEVDDERSDRKKMIYTDAGNIADKLDLSVNIDGKSPTISYSHAVWLKREIFEYFMTEEKMIDAIAKCYIESSNEYRALPVLFPYLVKERKRYSGRIMNSKMTSRRLDYYKEMMGRFYRERFVYRGVQEFKEIRKVNQDVINDIRMANRVYIYGAGGIGNECVKYLIPYGIRPYAFIVTDNSCTDDEINGIKVRCVDEMRFGSEDIIILALGKHYVEAVKEKLETKGANRVYMYEAGETF